MTLLYKLNNSYTANIDIVAPALKCFLDGRHRVPGQVHRDNGPGTCVDLPGTISGWLYQLPRSHKVPVWLYGGVGHALYRNNLENALYALVRSSRTLFRMHELCTDNS